MRRLALAAPRLGAMAAASAATLAIAHNANAGRPLRRAELRADDATRQTLDALYEGMLDGDDIPIAEQVAIDESGGHMAYGELTIRGVRELRPRLEPRSGDVFYDLGSGTGRCVLQAALEWPVDRAVGVELSASRNDIGIAALCRAAPSLRERTSLRADDMIACPGCEDATLVYCASLLFEDEFMGRLGRRLEELPRLRRVATLRRFPPGALRGFDEAPENAAPDDDDDVLAERVEVTWGAARVYLYERAPPAAAPAAAPPRGVEPEGAHEA